MSKPKDKKPNLVTEIAGQRWFLIRHSVSGDALAIFQLPDVKGIRTDLLMVARESHLAATSAHCHFTLASGKASIDLRLDWRGEPAESMADLIRDTTDAIELEEIPDTQAQTLLCISQLDWYQTNFAGVKLDGGTIHMNFVGKMEQPDATV